MLNVLKKLTQDKTKMLFVLVIFSMVILPTTYSRYIQRGMGSTSTYLAKWDVTMIANDDEELTLVARNNSTANYLLSITSISEVSSDYSLIVTNVPSDVTLTIDDSTEVLIPDNDGVIVVEYLGSFELGDTTTHNHTLTFISGNATISSNSEIELQVDVKQRISNEVTSS